MARSRRHTPIASITTAASEKQDKRWANRIHRSAEHPTTYDHVMVKKVVAEVAHPPTIAKGTERDTAPTPAPTRRPAMSDNAARAR